MAEPEPPLPVGPMGGRYRVPAPERLHHFPACGHTIRLVYGGEAPDGDAWFLRPAACPVCAEAAEASSDA